ncbi:MAG: class II fructose-bisphosphate aldolase, partial [bacterium]
FNTNNLEVTKAICKAASKYKMPILIQTTPSALEYAGMEQIFDIVKNEIEATGIRAAVHIDHGKDVEKIKAAIDAGWTSVMFDGSKFDFDENVHLTRQVVEYAHARGACVEAEVGVIGREEGGMISGTAVYSNPDEVMQFVEQTGIDSVAVSIGNEHGAPEGEKIKIDLLAKIADMVDIPLVLHGSSGLSEGDIRSSISHGVAKINIDTNIRKAFVHEIESSKQEDYRDIFKDGMEEIEKVVDRYIRLFGNL